MSLRFMLTAFLDLNITIYLQERGTSACMHANTSAHMFVMLCVCVCVACVCVRWARERGWPSQPPPIPRLRRGAIPRWASGAEKRKILPADREVSERSPVRQGRDPLASRYHEMDRPGAHPRNLGFATTAAWHRMLMVWHRHWGASTHTAQALPPSSRSTNPGCSCAGPMPVRSTLGDLFRDGVRTECCPISPGDYRAESRLLHLSECDC